MIAQTREMTRKSSKVCSQKRRQAAALQSGFAAKPFVSIRVHSCLALKHGNEVAQFIFHISGHCHGLGYLIT
jgi:hypothetical protein